PLCTPRSRSARSQVFLEVRPASGGCITAQVVHCQHHGQLLFSPSLDDFSAMVLFSGAFEYILLFTSTRIAAMSAPAKILELVKRFEDNAYDYRAPQYGETQTRIEFINPFF